MGGRGRSKKGGGRGKDGGPGPTSQKKKTGVASGDSQKEKQQATAVARERSTTPGPTTQVVGVAFVEQYYLILHQSPELIHRFYHDSSFLSRPDVNGNMTTVTTMKAIKEKILSLNYEDYMAEIETADSQESYKGGVIVVVTGCLIAKDIVRKKFTQTFFLAPQDKGYFILNDVFRYIGENNCQINSVPANGINENTSPSALAPEPVRKATDDGCVVCADTLKWVAYGPCGHKEVCSTCVIRLRFVCEDRRCCLCKCESNIIFVTRALGDYTKVINDFTAFPDDPPDGQVGPYWYHEGIQAFFDDLEQYKMVKAMCMLSCVVCQKNEQRTAGSRRRGEFKNIEQLKSHLLKWHELLMCSLCLEGRKVFTCEQKLYNKAQLKQHIRTGDSTVDGNGSERGGFTGHPMCEFCQNPFYGDNELYLHMSTEHYTCHICQRQHPEQHEYYRSYDDMEIHFRQEHFLCEDKDCLLKKFVVFSSNSELKRHTAMEHGRCMSRSKRNATLQIPVGFQYRQSYEQNHEGGGHGSLLDSPSSLISSVTQTSLAIGHPERLHGTSMSAQFITSDSGTREVNSIVGPFLSFGTIDSEPFSGYCNTQENNRYDLLSESSFPPLAATSTQQQQSERGGFRGHLMCEFCQNPFYGDNELYLHMSTEHYTCHICQRQHPEQHEYYRDYDDMEIHFHQEHFLCEDKDCLSKKFVVFSSNSELKRHTAMEHGRCMSRFKPNATLQIPVSVQYRQSYEQNHEGGGYGSLLDSPSGLISSVTQTSLAIGHPERLHCTSTSAQFITSDSGTREVNSIVGPFPSLTTIDSEPSSGYFSTQENSRYDLLSESSFPPLAATSTQQQQFRRISRKQL